MVFSFTTECSYFESNLGEKNPNGGSYSCVSVAVLRRFLFLALSFHPFLFSRSFSWTFSLLSFYFLTIPSLFTSRLISRICLRLAIVSTFGDRSDCELEGSFLLFFDENLKLENCLCFLLFFLFFFSSSSYFCFLFFLISIFIFFALVKVLMHFRMSSSFAEYSLNTSKSKIIISFTNMISYT